MTLPVELNRRYTLEEYLRLEEESEERHEYWDGYIVPLSQLINMAGGTYEHSRIGGNLVRALGNRLEGRGCAVMNPDMRIKAARSKFYLYPDASVVCGDPAFDPMAPARTTLLNPTVVIEVLSPSTELYDRGKKLVRYFEIPTLQEYLLVAQTEPRIDSYFRHPDGSWAFSIAAGADSLLMVQALNVSVPLLEIYAGVTFPPDSEFRADFR